MAKREKNIGGDEKRDEWEQKCFYMRVTLLYHTMYIVYGIKNNHGRN